MQLGLLAVGMVEGGKRGIPGAAGHLACVTSAGGGLALAVGCAGVACVAVAYVARAADAVGGHASGMVSYWLWFGCVRDRGGVYPVPQTTLPASQVGPGTWHFPSAVQVLPAGQYPAPEQQTLPVGIQLGPLVSVSVLERGGGSIPSSTHYFARVTGRTRSLAFGVGGTSVTCWAVSSARAADTAGRHASRAVSPGTEKG